MLQPGGLGAPALVFGDGSVVTTTAAQMIQLAEQFLSGMNSTGWGVPGINPNFPTVSAAPTLGTATPPTVQPSKPCVWSSTPSQ